MKISHIIRSVGTVVVLTALVLPTWIRSSFAQVSTEYLPNHGLSQAWERINSNFVKIQGAKKRGDVVTASVF